MGVGAALVIKRGCTWCSAAYSYQEAVFLNKVIEPAHIEGRATASARNHAWTDDRGEWLCPECSAARDAARLSRSEE